MIYCPKNPGFGEIWKKKSPRMSQEVSAISSEMDYQKLANEDGLQQRLCSWNTLKILLCINIWWIAAIFVTMEIVVAVS